MRELKCQTATSLDLSKVLSLTTTSSYFFTELERARRRSILKFTLTIKNVMVICSPLNGLGDFTNISFGFTPLTFSLLSFFFFFNSRDTHPRKKVIR